MMIKKLSLSFILILLGSTFSLARPVVDDDPKEIGKELWLEFGLSKKFTSQFSSVVLFNSLNQLNSSFKNYDNYIEGILKYKLDKSYALELLYRQEYSKEDDGTDVIEKRPQIRAGYTFDLASWNFRNRYKYELRLFENGLVKHRYRTDFQIKAPWTFSSFHFGPYMNEELSVSSGELSMSRCYLGLSGGNNQYSRSLYLVWQMNREKFGWSNMLGAGISWEICL
ncbi:MAG: DUF2490 domain-containing protein [Bacteroidota bacterium]|nr:DUF2490 domain-containing protein [Bacteroidota bacterium]